MEDKYIVAILIVVLVASSILAYSGTITGDQWMQIALAIIGFATGYGYGIYRGRLRIRSIGKWASILLRFTLIMFAVLLVSGVLWWLTMNPTIGWFFITVAGIVVIYLVVLFVALIVRLIGGEGGKEPKMPLEYILKVVTVTLALDLFVLFMYSLALFVSYWWYVEFFPQLFWILTPIAIVLTIFALVTSTIALWTVRKTIHQLIHRHKAVK